MAMLFYSSHWEGPSSENPAGETLFAFISEESWSPGPEGFGLVHPPNNKRESTADVNSSFLFISVI